MNYVNQILIKKAVIQALREDIGKGDITSNLIVPASKKIKAAILAREPFIVCGLEAGRLAFREKSPKVEFRPLVKDGSRVKKGEVIARIQGNARAILASERVALNFIGFLSGIATKTKRFVDAIKPFKTKIMDTRKTIPGLRELEKYAVRIGGGYNHRMSLDEMVLVKDNHLKFAGGFSGLSKLLRDSSKPVARDYKIELEAENFEEFKEALLLNPDVIMLDNMNVEDMKKAVVLRNRFSASRSWPKPFLEASGGISLDNVKQVASIGVEMISIGALTHSVSSVDISLEFL